jgi:hypothetical protein
MKKGGLQSNKARRVSFSSKVNCKFFNKNEAMPSSPLPTRKRTSTSPRRQRDEETEEVEDKENQAPSNISRGRRTSMKSGSANTTAAQAILEDEVLTMPLKGSFHSSLDDDSMGSFYTTPSSRSSFGAAGDLTRRFLDESMDLTQVAIADDLSSSSSPPRRQHSPSSPPLSRTIILNESLDLTGIATDAFVFRSSPSSPPDDGKREADETEERQPAPRRLARRRSVQGRQRPSIGGRASISSSSASLPEDCTLVFDTTMDMTLSSAPDVDLRAMIVHNDNGNEDDEDDDDDRKKDAAAEHTLLLGTTMDLTSVLDHHGRRDEDDLEGQRAGEEDAGRRAHQNNETQFTDDTMDLTMTSTNHRAKRRVSAYSEDEDEEVAAGMGEEETATCDATMDLTAVMEATMDLTSSLPSSPGALPPRASLSSRPPESVCSRVCVQSWAPTVELTHRVSCNPFYVAAAGAWLTRLSAAGQAKRRHSAARGREEAVGSHSSTPTPCACLHVGCARMHCSVFDPCGCEQAKKTDREWGGFAALFRAATPWPSSPSPQSFMQRSWRTRSPPTAGPSFRRVRTTTTTTT